MASERDTLNRIRQKCENVLAPGAVQYSALEACTRQVVRDCEVAVAETATTTASDGASPRPWFVNGHSIEANDKSLWLQNEKTGRGVVANLPSAPKWRFKKEQRAKMDALTAANAKLIVDAVNGRVGVSKLDTTTGNGAKMREACEMFVAAMDYEKCIHETMLAEAYQKAKAALKEGGAK